MRGHGDEIPQGSSASNATPTSVSAFDAYFRITERGSTLGREIRGGLVTFFTMAYIIALNPLIIGTAPDGSGNLLGGLPYKDAAGAVIGANVDTAITLVAAATALVAGVMTILMGVIGRFPIGIADRARAQRSARVHHRAADDLAAGDGPDRDRGS